MPNWTFDDLKSTKAGARALKGQKRSQKPRKASEVYGHQTKPKKPSGKATRVKTQPSKDEAGLNKLEQAWLEVLRRRMNDGAVRHIGIQDHGLKIGDHCRYHPDFMTIDTEGQITFWETKGFMRDDAQVKIKVAARTFPFYRFVLVKRRTKAQGGGFEETLIAA